MSCGVDFSLCLKPLFYSAYFARQFSDLVLRSYRSTRLVMISSQFCNCIKPDCPRPSHCRDGNAAPCKNGWSGEAALVRDGKVWCRPVAPSGQVVDPDFANGDFCAYGSWWRSQHLPPLMSAFVKLRWRSRRCSEWLLPAQNDRPKTRPTVSECIMLPVETSKRALASKMQPTEIDSLF